jgi:hypothetical protein
VLEAAAAFRAMLDDPGLPLAVTEPMVSRAAESRSGAGRSRGRRPPLGAAPAGGPPPGGDRGGGLAAPATRAVDGVFWLNVFRAVC